MIGGCRVIIFTDGHNYGVAIDSIYLTDNAVKNMKDEQLVLVRQRLFVACLRCSTC